MIKINLLPTPPPPPTKVYTQIALAAVAIIVALSVEGWWWSRLNADIAEKKDIITRKKRQLEELQAIIREVNKYEEKRRLLLKKLEVIDRLRHMQKVPVKLLMGLLSTLPDQVWLDSFSVAQGIIRMRGYGLSLTAIGNFLTALEDSPYFKNIELQSSVKQKFAGRDVYFFELTSNLDISQM